MLSFLIAQPNVEYLFPIAPDLMTDIGFPRQESDWKRWHKVNMTVIFIQ